MSPSVEVVNAEPSHIERIANAMRPHDVDEIWYSHQATPRKALEVGLRTSDKCWTALIDGKPAIMFGVSRGTLLTRTGIPWLLATDEMSLIKKQFIIESKKYIIEARDGVNTLENFVHVDNKDSIRWLKWIGFKLVEKLKVGLYQKEFWRFRMEIK